MKVWSPLGRTVFNVWVPYATSKCQITFSKWCSGKFHFNEFSPDSINVDLWPQNYRQPIYCKGSFALSIEALQKLKYEFGKIISFSIISNWKLQNVHGPLIQMIFYSWRVYSESKLALTSTRWIDEQKVPNWFSPPLCRRRDQHKKTNIAQRKTH